ncbi:MAG: outer membrane beta-barrel protein [Bdellovibrionales bacterium]|nr:outer membrane beta-barrel protein [Bdellovibrionales bacterium]
MLARIALVFITFSFSLTAYGARYGSTDLAFRGMAGYAGFGVAEFTVLNPRADFRMDQGTYIYLGGEKEIGHTGLFITINLNFMESSGQSLYDYTALGGTQYQNNPGSQIDFDSSHYQIGMGLKFKLFPTSWFRPYGEGGGLFGFHEVRHNARASDLTVTDGNHKTKDTLSGFGYYMEAGLEVDFSEIWGVRAAARYQLTETRPFETLGNEKIKYETRIFFFGIGRKF